MGSRIEQITLRGKAETRDSASPLLSKPGDAVVVARGKPRLLIIRCPCGCGDDLLINLDRRAGKAWHLYQNEKGLTLYPSYWRDDRCRSHFILWNSQIYWCVWESEESDDWYVSPEVETAVFAALPEDWFIAYQELAEQLSLIPWEALQACRQLVTQGRAVADQWPRREMFKRLQPE